MSGRDLPEGFSAAISLGEGGQARTWLAWQESLARWIVVKTDPRDRGELATEADLLERLSGAPVPALLARDLEAARPWIAMSWIDGVRLDCLPAEFDQGERLAIVAAAARTVAALHGRSIVHGDLSPANLIALPSGEVLAVDLGMASFGDSGLRGTWETFSPERLQGKPCSPASDIFSIGVLALHLLGRLPEAWTSSREEWTLAVLEDALPRLAEDLPPIARAVESTVENRSTALQLALEISLLTSPWPGERIRRKARSDFDELLSTAIANAVRSRKWADAWHWQRERIERSDDPEPLLPELGRFARERDTQHRLARPWILAAAIVLAAACTGLYFAKQRAPRAPRPVRIEAVGWSDPMATWSGATNPAEAFPIPAPPPGASLRVDGLPTDMPANGILLLSTGRHHIQLRDAVGVALLDTFWMGSSQRTEPELSTFPESTRP